jgi:hypothetical protein
MTARLDGAALCLNTFDDCSVQGGRCRLQKLKIRLLELQVDGLGAQSDALSYIAVKFLK